MERLLFTIEEVAEALGLSRSTIYRLLHRGDLVAILTPRDDALWQPIRVFPADS